MSLDGKIGPIPMAGTITAQDRQAIWDKTKCSACVRGRANMERSLTVSGPVSQLAAAHQMALDAIEKNKGKQAEGQKLPAGGGEFRGSDERKAVGKARRDVWETRLAQVGRGSSSSSQGLPGLLWDGWSWVPANWQAVPPWHAAPQQWQWHAAPQQQWPAAPQQQQQWPAAPQQQQQWPAAPQQPAAVSKDVPEAAKACLAQVGRGSSSSSSSSSCPEPKFKAQPKARTFYPGVEAAADASSSYSSRSETSSSPEPQATPQAELKAAKACLAPCPPSPPSPTVSWSPPPIPPSPPSPTNKRQKGGEACPPKVLLPTHLKGRTINVYTVGCKDCEGQRPRMVDILNEHGPPKSHSVLLDCRDFQGARCNVQWHYGRSTRVLTNIMAKDREHLQLVFSRVCKALQEGPDIENLIFFCDHGKHRSVGAADLTSNAMRLASDDWDIQEMHNLMREFWSRKTCGWQPCPECDQGHADKNNAYKQAAELFMQAWELQQHL